MTLEKRKKKNNCNKNNNQVVQVELLRLLLLKGIAFFCIFFFGPAVDFFLLKIPATGEESFSSENRTQNGGTGNLV